MGAEQHCNTYDNEVSVLCKQGANDSSAIVILGLCQQSVAHLLGITKQHVSVLLEEDGVINSRVADTKRPLHHNHLQSQTNATILKTSTHTHLI